MASWALLVLLGVVVVVAIAKWLGDRAFQRLERAKAFSLPHAEHLMRTDVRSPVLLLRSFADDAATIGDSRFEESLARYLSGYGPVITVADPHQLPRAKSANGVWSQRLSSVQMGQFAHKNCVQ
jgi:hypothetical protein